MSRAAPPPRSTDREKTAARLLKSTADRSYDPDLDIDWSAPLVDGAVFQLEHRISLYGTELWAGLTERQRIELGRHEAASVAGNGIWFELLLIRMLAKEVYRTDPTSRHAQYALTEIADECRHSVMFARAIERVGARAYRPRRVDQLLGTVLLAVGRGPALYGSILVAEEVLDRLQREAMADERVQPLIRMVNRIHVLEEARHVTFAREEVLRGVATLSGVELAHQRLLLAAVAFKIVRSLVNPKVYAAVGLDREQATRAALTNPYHRETVRWAGERVMAFLDDAGLVGGPGVRLLRRAGLLA